MRTKIKVGDSSLEVIHARNDAERRQGLSSIDKLDKNVGMLFHFNEPTTSGFWMLDTNIPLDIAFIKEGKIIDIQSMTPHSLSSHFPKESYSQALEVNKGQFETMNIKIGDSVQF